MKSRENQCAVSLPTNHVIPREAILGKEDLAKRPIRAPNYETQSRALVALSEALTNSPCVILQVLAEKVLEVLQADSAGISLLTRDGKKFISPALAGAWKQQIGDETPHYFCPLSHELDDNPKLLTKIFSAKEALVIPFHINGKVVGTVWAIAHDECRKFDAEDFRQLESLSKLAGAASQAVEAKTVQDARFAALNLMEDAIQARRATEKINLELRVSEELRRYSQQAAGAGTWTWNKVKDIVIWSEECYGLYGINPKSALLYETWLNTLHPNDRERADQAARRAMENQEDLNIEYRINHPLRGERWLSSIGRIINPLNRPGFMTGITLDITNRKHLEMELQNRVEELAATDRGKNNFLAILSHELRSPLNAIRGWIELIKRPNVTPERLRQGIDIIDSQSRAQAALISDLMDVQRLTTGKFRLETSEIELAAVLKSSVDAVLPGASEKAIQINLQLGTGQAFVVGDPNRIQQVFWNLLTNSIKFTPKGGEILVELQTSGSHVEVRITDSGEGISAEALPRIFERFRQADPSASRSHAGLGLGLTIVKQIVELHGGSIRCQSKGKGQGATFIVTLTLRSAEDVLRRRTLSVPTFEYATTSLGGAMVLVVDDEIDAREPLRQVLEGAGAEVIAVASVDEAIEVLKDQHPEVIVSDIGMPGRDGYDLIRSVRALPFENGGMIPAIALTAYAQAEDRDRALREGYQVHLAKPVGTSELLATIATLVLQNFGREVKGTLTFLDKALVPFLYELHHGVGLRAAPELKNITSSRPFLSFPKLHHKLSQNPPLYLKFQANCREEL